MYKTTLKKIFDVFLLSLIMTIINNASAQNVSCIVYDDLTISERTVLGISEQEFLTNKNSYSQTTLSVPANYTITQKNLEFIFGQIVILLTL